MLMPARPSPPAGQLIITRGRVVDPSQSLDEVADVVVAGDRIVDVVRGGISSISGSARVLDAAGLVVSPGFVDIHAHLRFPGQTDKETIASGTAAAVRGGFTTVCAMANADPVVDSGRRVEQVLEMAASEARCRVNVIGAVSRDLAGHENTNSDEIIGAGAVALSDDGNPVFDARVMGEGLRAGARLGVPVSAHEETRQGSRGSPNPCWPCTGEVDMVRRDLDLLRAAGGRLHVAHVSCGASMELISDAQAAGLPVTAEATPHHLVLSEEEWGGQGSLPPQHGYVKVNPPLRSIADMMAIREGLRTGVIGAVATDHAPHTRTNKIGALTEATFGFTAFELALPLLLELVRSGYLSLSTMIERLTTGPARAFALPPGMLAAGRPADITVFDPEAVWRPGRDTLVSKGKNTPLQDRPLQGRVRFVVSAGRLHGFSEDHGIRALRSS